MYIYSWLASLWKEANEFHAITDEKVKNYNKDPKRKPKQSQTETQTESFLLFSYYWFSSVTNWKYWPYMPFQPRYVVNQVTAGDYDCPRKVLKFLTDLHASFRMLNLRNDFLRKKFDGWLFIIYAWSYNKSTWSI